ncbi:MAG: hypothetical protein K6T27_04055 [Thermoleophilum sp.]|nr:hypothetical protein [Thermoleophilum sp.]
MPRRPQLPWFVVGAGCAAAAALPLVAQLSTSAALLFAPFVFLLLALVFGRYPGERQIELLRERFARRTERRRPSCSRPRLGPQSCVPRRASLLGRKRGLRAPPFATAAR